MSPQSPLPPEETLPRTDQTAPGDALVLGRTQEARGSEIQAGARAELIPSPLTQALSSMRGRLVAQTLIYITNNEAARNFTASRIQLMQAIVERQLPAPEAVQPGHVPLVVNICIGFSPLSIWLAQSRPDVQVIDIDVPDVIRKRRRRLRKLRHEAEPPNLTTLTADLGTTPLGRVLGSRRPAVITLTGAYFSPAQMVLVCRYLRGLLQPGGAVVIYLPWRKGIEQFRAALGFFKSQVGELPGTIETEMTVSRVFDHAGYREAEVIFPSQLAPALGLPTPIMDTEVLAVGRA